MRLFYGGYHNLCNNTEDLELIFHERKSQIPRQDGMTGKTTLH